MCTRNYIIFTPTDCGTGYKFLIKDKLCDQTGEKHHGGPKWPTWRSSDAESTAACAKACNDRYLCSHYVWLSNKGCRTYTSCKGYRSGFHGVTEYACEKTNPSKPGEWCGQWWCEAVASRLYMYADSDAHRPLICTATTAV